jgi:acyl-CoA dehydrogenase
VDELKTAETYVERSKEYQRRYKALAEKMGEKYETFWGLTPEI